MDKYRKVRRPREDSTKADNEVRVTAIGSVSAYVSFAAKVFNEMEKPDVVIMATGNALAKAITLAEIVKRRFRGLHQLSNIGSMEIIDEYEPLEEGLDTVIDARQVPFIEITLSKKELDISHRGYQPPIDESLVTDMDAEEMARERGRGRGKGRGKGKGSVKGRKPLRDDEGDEEEEEKPLPFRRKGKGKGKGRKGEAGGDDEDEDQPPQRKAKGGKGMKSKGKEYQGTKGSKGGKGGFARKGGQGGRMQSGGGKQSSWGDSWDNWSYNRGYSDWGNSWWGGGGGSGGGGQWNRKGSGKKGGRN